VGFGYLILRLVKQFVKFEDAVQEIFAVQAMPGMRFPELVQDERSIVAGTFVIPNEALSAVPVSLRHPSIAYKESL
jgi:hypothetical protein